jgi:hypothetical protein
MLWSLISSAYVIYLYRKLRAQRVPQPATIDGRDYDLQSEIDRLNTEIGNLERRLTGRGEEAAR